MFKTPKIGEDEPILTNQYFSDGIETTNQFLFEFNHRTDSLTLSLSPFFFLRRCVCESKKTFSKHALFDTQVVRQFLFTWSLWDFTAVSCSPVMFWIAIEMVSMLFLSTGRKATVAVLKAG